jgi:hypothetical protein
VCPLVLPLDTTRRRSAISCSRSFSFAFRRSMRNISNVSLRGSLPSCCGRVSSHARYSCSRSRLAADGVSHRSCFRCAATFFARVRFKWFQTLNAVQGTHTYRLLTRERSLPTRQICAEACAARAGAQHTTRKHGRPRTHTRVRGSKSLQSTVESRGGHISTEIGDEVDSKNPVV